MARERKFSLDDMFQKTKELLLVHGYDGFTFSILAEQLDVSRGTLYKYYDNKDELITDYMIHEMEQFLTDLKEINHYSSFKEQFEFLLDLILKHTEIHQFILIDQHIKADVSKKVRHNKEQLSKLHLKMYDELQNFVNTGKGEKILKSTLPNGLILGFIFQTVAIPNHFRIPHSEWVSSMKEIIRYGMFSN